MIAAQIRAELSAGRLKSGERLPPERDLAVRDGAAVVAEMERHLKRLHKHYLSLASQKA